MAEAALSISAPAPEGAPPAPEAPAPAPALAAVPPAPAPAPEALPEPVYDIKLPEHIKLEAATLDEVKAFAKANKLTVAEAQRAADLGVKMVSETQAKYAAEVEQVKSTWAEAAKVDKEFGGEKVMENVAVAKRVLDQYGTPELVDMLEKTGLGSHPEVIRAFWKIGQVLSEDSVASAIQSVGAREMTVAERLYGK